jgi:hypothetical protein
MLRPIRNFIRHRRSSLDYVDYLPYNTYSYGMYRTSTLAGTPSRKTTLLVLVNFIA